MYTTISTTANSSTNSSNFDNYGTYIPVSISTTSSSSDFYGCSGYNSYSKIIISTDSATNFKYYSSSLIAKVLSNFDSESKSVKIIDISNLMKKKWIVPKENVEVQVSFENSISASEFFEIGSDIRLEKNNLIFNDEELTYNYYMSIIDNFLKDYVVLKSYPSTKIKDFDRKYLASIPVEYEKLNLLAYTKIGNYDVFEGIYYVCDSKDLETTKKLLKEEVEKAESLIEDNSDLLKLGGTFYWDENKINSVAY